MTSLEPLIKALSRRDRLNETETALVASLPVRVRSFGRDEELVAAGSRPSHSCLMLSGVTGRELHLRDGSRQVLMLQVTGDFVDLHGLLLRQMDHSVVAMTDCEAAFIPHPDLRRVIEAAPHLGRLLWLLTLIDGAILRERVLSLGRRSAAANFAHLLCELYRRLEVVGLAADYRFELPLIQSQLADVLGLSTVHVNRSLKELRSVGLVVWQGTAIELPDFERLAALADFDATYLQLDAEPR